MHEKDQQGQSSKTNSSGAVEADKSNSPDKTVSDRILKHRPKYVIDEETALSEFEYWAAYIDLETDTSFMDTDDVSAFEKNKRRIVKEIRRGHAVIEDRDGQALFVYTPWHSVYDQPITIRRRKGTSIMAMDRKKKNQDAAKMYAMIADITDLPEKILAGLTQTDIKLIEAVFNFIMD